MGAVQGRPFVGPPFSFFAKTRKKLQIHGVPSASERKNTSKDVGATAWLLKLSVWRLAEV